MKIHKLPKCCTQRTYCGIPVLNLERYRAEQCFLPGCDGTQVSSSPKVPFVFSCANRIQDLLEAASPDPSMAGALPPGAWWEYANTNSAMPIDRQPYGPDAGGQARKSCTLAFALRLFACP